MLKTLKNIFPFILALAITGLIAHGALYLWQFTTIKRGCSEQRVIVRGNPYNVNLSDIYLKRTTSQEGFLISITDVYTQHYHNVEYLNGHLYVLRRLGYKGYPDREWSDELWVYDENKKGRSLFKTQGIDFRVSPNEKYAAINTEDKVLFLHLPGGTKARTFDVEDLMGLKASAYKDLMIRLQKWSSDGKYFWGSLFYTSYPQMFFRINTESWSILSFDVLALNLQSGEIDLNPDTGEIVFSDFPAMFDVESVLRFRETKTRVHLYVYDLASQTKKEIATSVAKEFKPRWIGEDKIEIENPKTSGRKVISIR